MSWQNAYAAKVDYNNIVTQVIVIPFSDDDDEKVTEYCNGIGLDGNWLDCSWLGARRGSFPSIGYTYDVELDKFVAPPLELSEE